MQKPVHFQRKKRHLVRCPALLSQYTKKATATVTIKTAAITRLPNQLFVFLFLIILLLVLAGAGWCSCTYSSRATTCRLYIVVSHPKRQCMPSAKALKAKQSIQITY